MEFKRHDFSDLLDLKNFSYAGYTPLYALAYLRGFSWWIPSTGAWQACHQSHKHQQGIGALLSLEIGEVASSLRKVWRQDVFGSVKLVISQMLQMFSPIRFSNFFQWNESWTIKFNSKVRITSFIKTAKGRPVDMADVLKRSLPASVVLEMEDFESRHRKVIYKRHQIRITSNHL